MKIKSICVGFLETNCYVIKKGNEFLIIDPGDEPEKIDKIIDGNVVGILITHSHSDHIGGVDYFVKKYNADIYDFKNLKEGLNKIGSFEFKVIYTPGHTDDSVTFFFEKEHAMFVGDFIFYRTIGRTDLPSGSDLKMKESLIKIKKYSDIDIYPGHGFKTTIDEEKKYNKYLVGK